MNFLEERILKDGVVKDGEIPIHSSSHLNHETKGKIKEKITKRFGKKHIKEEPVKETAENEAPDDEFLNAIIGDTDTYRVYLETEEEHTKVTEAEKASESADTQEAVELSENFAVDAAEATATADETEGGDAQ